MLPVYTNSIAVSMTQPDNHVCLTFQSAYPCTTVNPVTKDAVTIDACEPAFVTMMTYESAKALKDLLVKVLDD